QQQAIHLDSKFVREVGGNQHFTQHAPAIGELCIGEEIEISDVERVGRIWQTSGRPFLEPCPSVVHVAEGMKLHRTENMRDRCLRLHLLWRFWGRCSNGLFCWSRSWGDALCHA